MKMFLKIIIWTVLTGSTLVHAASIIAPTTPSIGFEVQSGVERILNLFEVNAPALPEQDPQINLETTLLRQVVRNCRARVGTEICVQSIDQQIRSFDQNFAERHLEESLQHDLALTVLHEIRLTAYGVERHGVER